jgi:GWxTD domain-containing protein
VISLFVILAGIKITKIKIILKLDKIIRYCLVIYFIGLSAQLIAQKQLHDEPINDRTPIYFESHISLIDSIFNCNVFYRIPYDNLVFTQANSLYSSGFGITIEIYEGEKFVKRVFSYNKVKSNNYNETTNAQIYKQGILSFQLRAGNYKLKPSLILDNTELEIYTRAMDLHVDSTQIYKPIYVAFNESTKDYSLINFQNSILFSSNSHDMLIPVHNKAVDKIYVKLKQNDKTIIDQSITKKVELNNHFFESNNGNIILNNEKEVKYQFFLIKNIGKKLTEGKAEIQIKINDMNLTFTSNVFWKNKPKSLQDVEQAIEYLSLVGYKHSADSLLNLPDDKQYKALYGFWKKIDADSSRSYSDVFNEYYSRIDFIKNEFNSLGKNDAMETDRGKTYLVFGKPDKIERKFNDVYDVLEIWEYKSIEKIIYFSDKTGTGKFERIK